MVKPPTFLVRLKDYLIAGLLLVAPIVLTIYALIWSFNLLDGILSPIVIKIAGRPLPGVGLVSGFLITLLAGVLTRGWVTRRLMKWMELSVSRLPLIRPLYGTLKQLTNALLSGSDKNMFKRVVMLEYPKAGVWSIGFVTSEEMGELGRQIESKMGKHLCSVFMVSSPNPTTGWLILVPEESLITLNVSVEEALKLIVSGGYVRPEDK